jgi:hypothetical protein
LGPSEAPTGVALWIDYTDAPVPQHYYVSDFVHLENLDPNVLLVFGKKETSTSDTAKLRNKIEIFFPAVFFVNQLWRSSREFHETLKKYVAGYDYEVPDLSRADVDADKVQTFHSNNVLMVLSGGEAMLDFFYVSPRDLLLKTRKRGTIELEALVRVVISPILLLSLMNGCVPLVEKLKERYPEQVEEDDETLESD